MALNFEVGVIVSLVGVLLGWIAGKIASKISDTLPHSTPIILAISAILFDIGGIAIFIFNAAHNWHSQFRLILNLMLIVCIGYETLQMQRLVVYLRSLRRLADKYILKHNQLLQEHKIENAGEVLAQACSEIPDDPRLWILRANYTDSELHDLTTAYEYLRIAGQLLEKAGPKAEKGNLAQYEFCTACLMITEEKLDEAVQHIRKSLDISYDQDCADFLKKLEEQIAVRKTMS
jgi:tetratricopeptide (TPR) repeat protein